MIPLPTTPHTYYLALSPLTDTYASLLNFVEEGLPR